MSPPLLSLHVEPRACMRVSMFTSTEHNSSHCHAFFAFACKFCRWSGGESVDSGMIYSWPVKVDLSGLVGLWKPFCAAGRFWCNRTATKQVYSHQLGSAEDSGNAKLGQRNVGCCLRLMAHRLQLHIHTHLLTHCTAAALNQNNLLLKKCCALQPHPQCLSVTETPCDPEVFHASAARQCCLTNIS